MVKWKIKLIVIVSLLLGTTQLNGQSQSSDTLTGQTVFNHFKQNKNIIGIHFIGVRRIIQFPDIRYGKFLRKQLCVGAEIGGTVIHNNHWAILGGPFLRYYILDNKISPFAEMNYHFNYFENSELSTKGIIHTGEINIGVAYTGIFNTLGLEIFGGYGIADGNVLQAPPNYTADSNVDTYIPLGLRINYHF